MSHLLITGASRGIGAACARMAAGRGGAVTINYNDNLAAAEAVGADVEAAGARALLVQGDMSVEADVIRLFDQAEAGFGPVTALINNAGIVGEAQPLAEMSADRIRRIIDVNVTGALLVAREGARRMSTSRGGAGGAMVNTSSAAAKFGSAHEFIDYAASKGAIDTMTKGLAVELARDGVRVNAVRPGLIDTEIHADAGLPNRVHDLKDKVPMGREGSAEEVAAAILWLLSDEASYITGSILDVGGGR